MSSECWSRRSGLRRSCLLSVSQPYLLALSIVNPQSPQILKNIALLDVRVLSPDHYRQRDCRKSALGDHWKPIGFNIVGWA